MKNLTTVYHPWGMVFVYHGGQAYWGWLHIVKSWWAMEHLTNETLSLWPFLNCCSSLYSLAVYLLARQSRDTWPTHPDLWHSLVRQSRCKWLGRPHLWHLRVSDLDYPDEREPEEWSGCGDLSLDLEEFGRFGFCYDFELPQGLLVGIFVVFASLTVVWFLQSSRIIAIAFQWTTNKSLVRSAFWTSCCSIAELTR